MKNDIKAGAARTDSLRHWAKRYGPWLLLLIAAAAYYPRFIKDGVGVQLYPEGAGCLLDGAPMLQCSPYFTYPPAFALLMTPFVPLSLGLRNLIWYALSVGATVGCFWISEKLAFCAAPGGWSERERDWFRVIAVVLSLKFVLAVFEYQAFDTFVLLFVVLGLWGLVSGRDVSGGAALALGAAIKATPLLFLPYLVVKRRFKAAAAMAVVLVAVSFLPDIYAWAKGYHANYLQTWVRLVVNPAVQNDPSIAKGVYWDNWMAANLLNHSFRGIVARLLNGTSLVPYSERILYAGCAIYAALIGLLLLKSPRRREFLPIDGAVLVISMLMLSPMTGRYHFVALILPYAVALAMVFREPKWRRLGIATLVLSFVLATATSNDLAGGRLTDWSYAHNFLPLGAMVLLVYFAALILAPARAGDAALAGDRQGRQHAIA